MYFSRMREIVVFAALPDQETSYEPVDNSKSEKAKKISFVLLLINVKNMYKTC